MTPASETVGDVVVWMPMMLMLMAVPTLMMIDEGEISTRSYIRVVVSTATSPSTSTMRTHRLHGFAPVSNALMFCTWLLLWTGLSVQNGCAAQSDDAMQSNIVDSAQDTEQSQSTGDSQSSADFVHPDVQLTKLAFGSCHKNARSEVPPIWDAIRRENVDAWLWTGDAVYPPKRNKTVIVNATQTRTLSWAERYGPTDPSVLRQQFRELHTNDTVGYNQFHPPHGIYGVWDDHDFGGNDMGKEMPQKAERKRLYWEDMLRLPAPTKLRHSAAQETRDGVYHSVEWGGSNDDGTTVKAILLDTRWFRDEHCIPSVAHRMPLGNGFACVARWAVAGLHLHRYVPRRDKPNCSEASILGTQQWEWLQDQLDDTRAKVIVIVSSIQVLTTNPVMESWGHFPMEQKRLVELIDKTQRKPNTPTVVLLSGDVHHAEFLGSAGMVEVTSSGMTHDCSQLKLYGSLCRPLLRAFDQHRRLSSQTQDSFYIGRNYGVLSVDWAMQRIVLEIKTRVGQSAMRLELPLNRGGQNDDDDEMDVWRSLPQVWDGHLIPKLQGVVAVAVSVLCAVVVSRVLRKSG